MIKDFIFGSLDDIKYVAIESKYNCKWVLCLHRERQRWECPGGHVEPGESALAAAKRELYEETGATDYDIYPLWDFQALNNDGSVHNNGRTYLAIIKHFDPLPEISEMESIGFFCKIPDNVTYNRDRMAQILEKAERCEKAIFE